MRPILRGGHAAFNHPSGFFCGAERRGYGQDHAADSSGLHGANFWQLNVYGCYRWWRRRAEARLALLNLTNQDYRLNPLNLTTQLPRARTLGVSLRFSF